MAGLTAVGGKTGRMNYFRTLHEADDKIGISKIECKKHGGLWITNY